MLKECAALADFVCLFVCLFVLFAYLAYSFFDVFISVAVVGSQEVARVVVNYGQTGQENGDLFSQIPFVWEIKDGD